MSGKSIQVLHVLSRMHPGGVERWLMYVMNHIDRKRYRFTFCTSGEPGGDYEQEVEALGGRFVRCRWNRAPWRFGREFRRILRGGDYDIVHAHQHNLAGYVVHLAAREAIAHRIVHLHSTSDGEPSTLPRKAYRALTARLTRHSATHVLGCSRGALEGFLGPDWVNDNRMRVLHYGIQCDLFEKSIDRAGVRAEFAISDDVPLIIHVGRLTEAKNHHGLIEAVRVLHARRADVRCLLVGEGELRSQIENHIAAAGLERTVHMAGQRSDVARLMKAADILVMPSTREGLPVTLIEATAAGLRAVVADLPGMREANETAAQAELVPPKASAEQWADVILDVLSRPAPDAGAALERVRRSSMNCEYSGAALAETYDACMSGRRFGRP